MDSSLCVLWFQFAIGVFMPWILQTVGLFTNLWVRDSDKDVNKGLFYQVSPDGKHTYEVLDGTVLGLHCTSFALLTLFTIVVFITIQCFGPSCRGGMYNDDDDTCYCCCGWSFYCGCFWFYFLAGCFGFSGCVRIGTLYPLESLGVSFYMCLVSFLLIWLMMITLACDFVFKKRDEEVIFKTLIQSIYEDL